MAMQYYLPLLYLAGLIHVEEGDRTLKKIRPLDREPTAFHEAGHTLVGYLLDFDIDEVSIVGGEGIRGVTLGHWHKKQAFQGVVDYDITKWPPK
jgi:hypothetical protein